jgi:hypothetical protein
MTAPKRSRPVTSLTEISLMRHFVVATRRRGRWERAAISTGATETMGQIASPGAFRAFRAGWRFRCLRLAGPQDYLRALTRVRAICLHRSMICLRFTALLRTKSQTYTIIWQPRADVSRRRLRVAVTAGPPRHGHAHQAPPRHDHRGFARTSLSAWTTAAA